MAVEAHGRLVGVGHRSLDERQAPCGDLCGEALLAAAYQLGIGLEGDHAVALGQIERRVLPLVRADVVDEVFDEPCRAAHSVSRAPEPARVPPWRGWR